MYCYKCGKEISETVKFCPYCGTEQGESHQHQNQGKKDSGKKNVGAIIRKILLILIIIPLAIFGLLVLFALIGDDEDDETISATEKVVSDISEVQQPDAEPEIPEDGWLTVDGDRYYFEDGLKYVELHEIDNELYYFDEDGVLVVNDEVRYESVTLEAGKDGKIDAITYDAIYGEWAEEDYRFGNGGSSSILKLSKKVENCDTCTFYLESHGQRGAKVNGNWKVYIRCNGQWEFVKKINYSEPNGSFTLVFDSPKTFDAITAHPTVQGNATYSSLFYLEDVHCLL